MEHFKPIVELMKVSIEKYGLWQTIIAFLILFSIPILIWKLPEIIAAIKPKTDLSMVGFYYRNFGSKYDG